MKTPNPVSDGKLIIMVSASALKESSCRRRTFLTVLGGYKSKVNYNDIEFGSAFHIFREIYRSKGHDVGFALGIHKAREYFTTKPMIIKGNKKYLDLTYLQKACIDYAARYEHDNLKPVMVNKSRLQGVVLDDNNTDVETPLLECKFTLPYYSDDQIEVIIAGTIDEVAKIQSGIYVIADCKTTAVREPREYFNSYELSPQMYMYRWVIKQYAKDYPDSIWAELDNSEVGIQIDGIFHSGSAGLNIERSQVYMYKQEQIAEFDDLLTSTMTDIIQTAKKYIANPETFMPTRQGILNGSCQTIFGKCKFSAVCAAPDDFTRDLLLERDYRQAFYNPLDYSV